MGSTSGQYRAAAASLTTATAAPSGPSPVEKAPPPNRPEAKSTGVRGGKAYSHISDLFSPVRHADDPRHRPRSPVHPRRTADERRPEEYAPTGRFTDHVFAACSILGYAFAPRIRDLPCLRSGCTCSKAPVSPEHLRPLVGGNVNAGLIDRNWTDILRGGGDHSRRDHAAEARLCKLAAYPRVSGEPQSSAVACIIDRSPSPRRGARCDLQGRTQSPVLLGETGMGSIVVCISVRNRHVDWVGPDWTMCPVTGPCPASVSPLAAPGNALLVGVHRSSDGAVWRGCAGGVVSHEDSRRHGPRCSAFDAAAARKRLGTKTGNSLSRTVAVHPGPAHRPHPPLRRDLHRGIGCGSGVRVLPAPAAGRRGDFRRQDFSDRRMASVATDAPWRPRAATGHRLSRSRLNDRPCRRVTAASR